MIKAADDRLHACPQCGREIDLTTDEDATVTIAARGGEPNVWIIEQGGREVHRCTADDAASP